MYQNLSDHVRGVAPLVMHNGQTADPRNPFAKAMREITSKKKKTEADLEQLQQLEWKASLYIEDGRVVVPGYVLESTLINGGKKDKRGQHFKAGIIIDESALLQYDGPSDIKKLANDSNFFLCVAVRNPGQAGRVMRTRAIFPSGWQLNLSMRYDDAAVSASDIERAWDQAGAYVGLCDWRPRYGRFEVVSIQEVKKRQNKRPSIPK